jgi:LPXTG-motif cell wall-anchored protein
MKFFRHSRRLGLVVAVALLALALPTVGNQLAGTAHAGIFDATGKTSIFDRSRGATVFSSGIAAGSVGYQVLYEDIFVASSNPGFDIDALVTVTAKDGSFDITVFDTSTVQAANYFEISRDTGNAAGRVTLRFDFFEGGTYTGVNTGIPATLQNVSVTSIDLDAGGIQYTDFFGYQSYRFSTDTRLQAYTSSSAGYPSITNADIPAGFTRFHQNTYPSDANGGSNEAKDAVQASFSSFSTFSVTVGNLKAGGSYYGISFHADGICAVVTGSCTLATAINNPANRPPTSTDTTRAVATGVATTLATSNFGTFSDPDSNPFVRVNVATLPASGTLEYDNSGTWTPVTVGQDITTSDIDAGKLRYTTSTASSFTFNVNDGLVDSSSTNTLTFTLAANTQTINFANPGTKYVGDGTFGSAATATSGLDVTLVSSTTGVCTVSNATQPPTITPVAAGTCVITASQAGNGTYAAAADVSRTFTISAGTAPTTTAAPTPASASTTTIEAGAAISGVVWLDRDSDFAVDADELPIVGLSVRLTLGGSEIAQAATGSDGSYSFSKLSAGSYTVSPSSPSAWSITASRDSDGGTDWVVTVTLGSTETRRADFAGTANGSIVGDVKDESTNDGVGKASVACTWAGLDGKLDATDRSVTVTANDSGRFTITGLPAGSFSCVAIDRKTSAQSGPRLFTVSSFGAGPVAVQPLLLRKLAILPSTGQSSAALLFGLVLLVCGSLLLARRRATS